ncbi:MAG: hypothetical protein C3F18_00415 [Nitrosomonadales bacterium]|nr:MAG: hypothetical protein C3F18_00415 [Nitrosomonadales bacterium]
MFYKQKDWLRRWVFDRQVKAILQSQPLELGDMGSPQVLSQLQHKDVLMYLAAIKSFALHVPPGGVHIVDDGSLTAEDRALLAQQVPGMRFLALEDCREPGLPAGGTWERLTAIARLSQNHYVIQLDADTLTRGPIDEVATAALANRAFTIGTWNGQTIETACERAEQTRARNASMRHVQMLAEAHFDRLSEAESLKYVRGCSGFSGFPAGSGKLELMRSLSSQLQQLIGDKWREWGSEQVMSNLIVANQPDAVVLPHPDYADCEKMQPDLSRFVHFIGTCRFRGGYYADMINRLDWKKRVEP